MKKIRVEGILIILCVLLATAVPAAILKGKNTELSYDRLEMYFHGTNQTAYLSLEEYTAHITQALRLEEEMEKGALEALAIAARTMALLTKGTSCNHDFCDSPEHSLSYEYECSPEVSEAVKNTSGLVISLNGALAPAFVHHSSYLVTESSLDLTGREVPCLVSVSSPESVEPSQSFVSFEEAKMILEIKLSIKDFNPSKAISITYNGTGRAKYVKVAEQSVSGTDFARAFGLESSNIKLEKLEKGYSFTVYGKGNGLGMSICGANVMAKDGALYDTILLHYYPGCEITPVYKLIK